MKVTVEKETFLNAITVVMKGMSARSTLPILSGIYIAAQDNETLILQTTDLEVSVKNEIEAYIEEYGDTVVSGKILYEIVRSLPEASISLSLSNSIFTITCLDSEFTLSTMNPEDFPSFPDTQSLKSISLPTEKINKMVKKVAKAVSKDESRAVLTGIFFKIQDKKMSLVATDSYRLAISEVEVEENSLISLELIIPGNIFDEICKLSASEETLEICEGMNQIIFKFGRTIFITRKIEGNYPNYLQIIPKEKNLQATIDTATLIAAVKRVSILSQSHSPIKFHFIPSEQSLVISSSSQDIGGAQEKLLVQAEGDDLEIGFNHQYIIDGLAAINAEEFTFEAQNPQKPGILKVSGEEYFFYLTMPVRLDR